MLTKHFYERDEVLSALSWSILQRRVKEACFWCLELIDSGEVDECLNEMVRTWMWHKNFLFPEWIHRARAAYTYVTIDTLIELCVNLTLCSENDSSVWSIFALQGMEPERISECSRKNGREGAGLGGREGEGGAGMDVADKGSNAIERYFTRAIRHGKARCAWWAAHYIPEETVWALLQEDFRQFPIHKTLCMCSAIVFKCGGAMAAWRHWTPIGEDIRKEINRLDSLFGRKCRREYTIPFEALYGCTVRGHMKSNTHNLNRLNDIECSMMDGGIWKAIGIECGFRGVGEWISDDEQERFYSNFIDDIPDEWSKDEKTKSHGSGVLRSTEVVTLAGIMRRWFSAKSRCTWGFETRVSKACAEVPYNGNIMDIANTAVYPYPDVDTLLAPILKKLVIA